jgi:hypothetical protein
MGANQEAVMLLKQLTTQYPRDFYAWQVIAFTELFPLAERERALQVLKSLDPFNKDL